MTESKASPSRSPYQVIARKWRPQSFQDLIGQGHIATTLQNALRNQRLHQALLFTGPRGTGKTSSARILAKSVRCTESVDFVPCNKCRSCEDITNGRSLDVIEIDGASNNGVDAVRELRETISYMPSTGKFKIYIIDEVHMLTSSAFNALLKTLEEPPPHVIFVMATTELQKVPATILSRCQRFDFRRIPSRDIAAQLEKICLSENVLADRDALWILARQADGSLRDSQSLLDQIITYADGHLTLQKVTEVLGLTDRTLLLDTVSALIERNTAGISDVLEKAFRAGYDPKVYAQDLLEELRNALMVRLDPNLSAGLNGTSTLVDLPESEISSLRELTSQLSEEDIHLLFDMALKGINDLLRAQDPRIVLEMLLLRMSAAPRIVDLSRILSSEDTSAHPTTSPAPALKRSSATAPMPKSAAVSVSKPAAAAETKTSTATEANVPTAAPKSNDPWVQFVDNVKRANSLLGAMLENTHMMVPGEGKIQIGVPKKMAFLFDKIKEPENVKKIETFLETFWNKKILVEIKLSDEKTETHTPKTVAEKNETEVKKSIEQQVANNPLVRSAQNVFKTQVKVIKERQ